MSAMYFKGLTKSCAICLCCVVHSLFGKPDVGKLGPGQVASSERMVVASCPEKLNLLKPGVPVLVHR